MFRGNMFWGSMYGRIARTVVHDPHGIRQKREELGKCAVAASYRAPAFPSEYRGPLLAVVSSSPGYSE